MSDVWRLTNVAKNLYYLCCITLFATACFTGIWNDPILLRSSVDSTIVYFHFAAALLLSFSLLTIIIGAAFLSHRVSRRRSGFLLALAAVVGGSYFLWYVFTQLMAILRLMRMSLS